LDANLRLSVIIVNHRSEAILNDCLLSIDRSDHQPRMEIIVVDNPPDVSAAPKIKLRNVVVKRMAVKQRIGFAAACNLGADKAVGDYLLFLNPDVKLKKTAIDRLYSTLKSSREVGIVTGRLTNADGSFQPSCRRFPRPANLFFSRGFFLHRWFKVREGVYTLPDYPEITTVEAAAAAMMMIPKKLFDQLGGFDESFFLYMEDTDLCYRLAGKGYKILYVPGAEAVHLWGHSTDHYRFRRIIWHHVSAWRYFRKHHKSIRRQAILLPLVSGNCLLSLIRELFTLSK
jgi:GT2 family glycosyltransferase